MRPRVRWSSLLVVTAGCNGIFGVDPPVLDGSPVTGDSAGGGDAAPAACPQVGTLLQLSASSTQVTSVYCWDYSLSPDAGLAVASCMLPTPKIVEGPLDGDLTMMQNLPSGYDHPRLSPEGDELILRRPISPATYFRYRRTAGIWTDPTALAIGSPLYISTPSRGGPSSTQRRLIAVDPDYSIRELIGDGAGGWTLLRTYPPGALGVDAGSPGLSEDGQRLLMTSGSGPTMLSYADRDPSLPPFTSAQALTSIANPQFGAFLTADCGRVYYSRQDTAVFYTPQK